MLVNTFLTIVALFAGLRLGLDRERVAPKFKHGLSLCQVKLNDKDWAWLVQKLLSQRDPILPLRAVDHCNAE